MQLKILKTCSYGAGWSTWADDSSVADFMLTYQPIIDYIENFPPTERKFGQYVVHDLHELHPLVTQMLQEIKEKFGEAKQPYVGGAKNLEVYKMEHHQPSLVEMLGLRNYDGNEHFR